jgi:hypothetical protein
MRSFFVLLGAIFPANHAEHAATHQTRFELVECAKLKKPHPANLTADMATLPQRKCLKDALYWAAAARRYSIILS